ncbi:MAG TPA: NAD(+) synthase [Candidatus Coprousia avicola]|nr:NAD(+) synthase [Candidatus Coprousia avicola]
MEELYGAVGSGASACREQAGDGFFRIAAASPKIRVADVEGNAEAVLAEVRRAARAGVGALVLPELTLTGYTCADLFFDRVLLRSCERALARILAETRELPLLFTVGLPVAWGEALYNCAAVCCAGSLLGLTVKSNLPNYGEFYERRWFTPAPANPLGPVSFAGQSGVALGARIVYRCDDPGMEDVRVGVEICEDLWVAAPPSTDMATAQGAAIILNLSASDEIIGKSAYRRELVRTQSARLFCAYAYADASEGESTTDLVFAGENLVAENGSLLAKTPLFTCGAAVADVDLDRLMAERRRTTTWERPAFVRGGMQEVRFSFAGCEAGEGAEGAAPAQLGTAAQAGGAPARPSLMRDALAIDRVFPPAPFVPADAGDLAERCEEILNLQAHGLATRLAHTGTKRAVIGLSGGLDSTLALLVTVRAFDLTGLDRTGITAVSMPGFGTTTRTKTNAQTLAESLGVDFREISIHRAVEQHFVDIGHDPAVTDVTYENSQARERTQILMDLANSRGGFVIGTGDLSELALGWATYNGDHMSMYAVNASVPKTLVRYLVDYAAGAFGGTIEATLRDILATPVSPELLPPTGDGEIAQRTEDLVGPYELHDYFLYYLLRFGFAPGKIFRMACRSFAGAYDRETILAWLRVFYRRFFAQQFKRSCLPDGPKVGSVTLSPRGDWRMPSDASARIWLAEIDRLA